MSKFKFVRVSVEAHGLLKRLALDNGISMMEMLNRLVRGEDDGILTHHCYLSSLYLPEKNSKVAVTSS